MAGLPTTKAVKDLFEGLLGRDVQIGTGDPVHNADSGVLAIYVNDATKMSAVISVDLKLAAYLGTSIALIPAGGAAAAIEDRYLPETVFENVGEVLNVFASVLNEASSDHHRLYSTYRGAPSAPVDAAAAAASLGNRLDLSVTVEKYGTGKLSCIVC